MKGQAGSPYAVKDYYDVDPDLAEDPHVRQAELDALIKRTHQAGLQVLMDFIPNHVARTITPMRALRASQTSVLRTMYSWRSPRATTSTTSPTPHLSYPYPQSHPHTPSAQHALRATTASAPTPASRTGTRR